MNEREVWKLISHSLQGLQALHELKIMHRDMKSANIFISNGCYKLGDLNVSKIVKNKLAYTQTGTPYYASPEVWRDEPYDSKSDIWSFGNNKIYFRLCHILSMCAASAISSKRYGGTL
jgi:NIMA (never in mitosis gene a)-related kinase